MNTEPPGAEVVAEVTSRFSWNYDGTTPRVADLYQRGKAGQWDPQRDIDWSPPVEYGSPLGRPADDGDFPYPTAAELGMSAAEWDTVCWAQHCWTVSQFLHGEQGALLAAARLVEVAPDLDSKYFAATQVMDEARHVEVFSRYLREKLGRQDAIDEPLRLVLTDILGESRWDMVFLGMQIIAEGYALASFRLHKAIYPDPVIRQITERVARDEARHMSFGLLALDGHVEQLTGGELAVREEFVCDSLSLLASQAENGGIWPELKLDDRSESSAEHAHQRTFAFRRALFGRVLPNLARLGLFTPRVREQCEKLGLGPR